MNFFRNYGRNILKNRPLYGLSLKSRNSLQNGIIIKKNVVFENKRFLSRYRRFGEKEYTTNLERNIIWVLYSKKLRYGVFSVIAIMGIVYIVFSQPTPYTKRRQLILIPDSYVEKMGQQSERELLRQYGNLILPQNHPITIKVAQIMNRLLTSNADEELLPSKIKNLNWEVHVIADPNAAPNAFVLPGGKVFVFTSILPICKNDDGLATVLSHETAHVVARHTSERISQSPLIALLGILLYVTTGSSMGSSLLRIVFALPASRKQESEADHIGLMLSAAACFDPKEAPLLWERMSQMSRTSPISRFFSGSSGEYLSTHPSDETRLVNMEKWQDEAMRIWNASGCGISNNFFSNRFTGF